MWLILHTVSGFGITLRWPALTYRSSHPQDNLRKWRWCCLTALDRNEKQHRSPFKESFRWLPESPPCLSSFSLSLSLFLSLSATCDVTDKEFPTGETAGRLSLISDNMWQGLTGPCTTYKHTQRHCLISVFLFSLSHTQRPRHKIT